MVADGCHTFFKSKLASHNYREEIKVAVQQAIAEDEVYLNHLNEEYKNQSSKRCVIL